MAYLELFTLLYRDFGNKNNMVIKNHLTAIAIWFMITIETKQRLLKTIRRN